MVSAHYRLGGAPQLRQHPSPSQPPEPQKQRLPPLIGRPGHSVTAAELDESLLATLDLPAGRFVVLAKGVVHSGNDALWACWLKVNGRELNYTETKTQSGSSNVYFGTVVLWGILPNLGPTQTVTMSCQSGQTGSDVRHIRITVMQIAS